MPYVYVDELEDGMEEVDVRSAGDFDVLQAQCDEMRESRDALVNERDSLLAELDAAKTKFADAFLSSQSHADAVVEKREDEPMSYDALFSGRRK